MATDGPSNLTVGSLPSSLPPVLRDDYFDQVVSMRDVPKRHFGEVSIGAISFGAGPPTANRSNGFAGRISKMAGTAIVAQLTTWPSLGPFFALKVSCWID